MHRTITHPGRSFQRFQAACLAALFACGLARPAGAVPANPQLATVQQADGTKVAVRLKGDEFYHWSEDAAGYTVVRDAAAKNWVYAEKTSSGALRPGSHKVGGAEPALLGLEKGLRDESALKRAKARRTQREASGPYRVLASRAAAAGYKAAPARVPAVVGTMKNLVILARFAGAPVPSFTQAQFTSLFNDNGYNTDGAAGSVQDYYKQVSYGKLTVQSVVSPWVILPQTYDYYGANDPSGLDLYPREMARDAINALHATGFDFSQYDMNHDGEIDGLTIIHSGRGEEYGGNNPNYIWSHQWELISPITYDGVTMSMYHTEPEIRGWDGDSGGITRIGVICHETGHFLGLPDLYDTTDATSGLGNFCLMSGGSWNGNNGTSPAHMSAWCKKELTWAAATQLTSGGTKSLAEIEISSNSLYLLRDATFPSGEYFLLENRQGYGFDSGLPGTNRGLLIWHVDENRSDNTDPAHYMVSLEEASGTQHLHISSGIGGNDSDYYRSGNNTSFTDSTTPDSRSYYGTTLKLPVTSVSATGNPMTFFLGVPDISSPTSVSPVNDGTGADITYTTSLTQLAANWSASSDAESGIARYWYTIGTSAGGTDVVDWTDAGMALAVTRTSLDLTNGQTYYFSVKAENGAGLTSPVATSNGQKADADAPTVVASVYDGSSAGVDAAFSGSLTDLSANWTAASDAQSGVVKYWYAIGTSAGGTQIRGWTDNGAATSVTAAGLSLSNGGKYYFSVKAENGAGLTAVPANSDGQTVDNTQPATVGTVNDGTGDDVAFSGYNNKLSANWTASSDAQSGVVRYWYAIGTTPGGSQVLGWTNNGLSLSVTRTGLSLADGQIYYFMVRAENGAGLFALGAASNGQTVDITPPGSVPQIYDGDTAGVDAAYAGSVTRLSANWSAAADAQSGIAKYWYAIGSIPGSTDVADWTDNGAAASVTRGGLSLNNGEMYYFTVKAENGAGLQSSAVNSDGQQVDLDLTPPADVAQVNDGTGADTDYAGSLTQLSANWTASSDPQSGLAHYWYGIGTAAGLTDVAGWADNGLLTAVTRTGLTLENGRTYYFTVKAENGAGLLSGPVNSDGQTVAVSSADPVGQVNDGLGTDIDYVSSLNTLSANWGQSAHASGIDHYAYAVGTTSGSANVAGWASTGLDRHVTATGLGLSGGVTYYVSVKAYPVVGAPSAVTSSDGQKVDITSPTAQVAILSAVPANVGAFSARLTVNEANAVAGTPALAIAPGCGAETVPLILSFQGSSIWTADGYVETWFSTGTACLRFSASDLAGNSGTALGGTGATFNVDPVISGAAGATLSNSDGNGVLLPAGVLSGSLFVAISTVAAARYAAADLAAGGTQKIFPADLVREFTARDTASVPISNFDLPVTITLSYPDADSDGRIDGNLIDENLARIYYLDEPHNLWTPVPGCVRDTVLNTVSADVSHFSVYSVRAQSLLSVSLSGLKAYPNPCDLTRNATVNIAGIPLEAANVKVYIYDSAGDLVRTLTEGDGITALNAVYWNGRLKGGGKAATGLYLYAVKTSNYGSGKGKFFIVW